MQVSPVEVEQCICQMDQVADAAVIGLPDEDAGELPLAFVVLKDGVSCSIADVSIWTKKGNRCFVADMSIKMNKWSCFVTDESYEQISWFVADVSVSTNEWTVAVAVSIWSYEQISEVALSPL